jgi:aminopeptidase N
MSKRTIFPVYLVFLIIFSGSCSVIGINRYYKTPARPFKYPVFTEKDSLRGMLSEFRKCYDVKYYDLSVKFYPQTHSIQGKVEFYATAESRFKVLQIDLYPNMILDSIVFVGNKLLFQRRYGAVFITFPDTVEQHSLFTFEAYYHGKPLEAKRPPWEGGFVWKKDSQGKTWAGVTCEVYGSSLWWPSKDHLSDEPDSMTMHYSVPSPLRCVANGVLVDSIVDKDNYITYTWKVHYPINTYNVTFYIGNFKDFSIPYHSDSSNFKMSFYVFPENLIKAENHFMQAKDILNRYEHFYGSYPWPKDGYKLIESPYEGMEHQSAIAYGNRYKNYSYLNADYIILHESAHEWWGNSITVPDYAEIWIQEGFATYSEALYVEATQGYEAYLRYLMVYSMFIKNKRPVVGPKNVNYWDYKDSDVYMKGALLLHTLRNILNDEALFREILRDFYQKYKYGSAVSDDFIRLVNEKTGKDYSSFFKQYLYNRSCPELQWEYVYDMYQGKGYLYYRFQKANDDFSIPVRIKMDDKSYIIHPTKKLQKSEISNPKSILINTDYSYIAVKRTSKFK